MPPATHPPNPLLAQRSRVSVVRQVAIILALWCAVVMAGLLAVWLLRGPGDALADHYAPAKKEAAVGLLFKAIRAVDGAAPAALDAKAWADLLPVCARNPPHGLRGQSVFDALVEQTAALDQRLERLTVAGAADADGNARYSTCRARVARSNTPPFKPWCSSTQANSTNCRPGQQTHEHPSPCCQGKKNSSQWERSSARSFIREHRTPTGVWDADSKQNVLHCEIHPAKQLSSANDRR